MSLLRTREILARYSFCWRSTYTNGSKTSTGRPQLIPNVRVIRPRDALFVYFGTGSDLELLGAFLVQTPVKAVALDDVTALGIVDDPKLDAALCRDEEDEGEEKYPRDPFLNTYTGFFVVKDDFPRLPKSPPRFGRNAIVALRDGA